MKVCVLLPALSLLVVSTALYAEEMTWQMLESIKLGMTAAQVAKIIGRPVINAGNGYEVGNFRFHIYVSSMSRVYQVDADETRMNGAFDYLAFKSMLDAKIKEFGKCDNVAEGSGRLFQCYWKFTRTRTGAFGMHEQDAATHINFDIHDGLLDKRPGSWRLR